MATLVSEGWIAGRELDPYPHFQQNNRPRLTPVARTQPRTAASWLPSQNNVATGGTGANNPATNTNNSGNARRRNNAPRATQNNASQQNAATSPAGQSQPQGRNRNRNRNRNGNRDAQQGSSDSPNSQPGPGRGRGRGQNNRGGQRSNQPNTEDLTTDPNTGEPISKRAAKRRRAKARKAAREATGGQNNGQQLRNQPQPSTSRPGAVVNQPHASSATQVPNTGTTSNARPAASVTSVPPTTRYPSAVHPSPQPQRTVTTATRPTGPDITPVANTNNGATQSTSANSETNNRDSLRDDTLRRWNNFLDPDASRTVRPTNSATSSNNPPPIRLGVVRQAPAAPPLAPLQPRRVAPAAPAVRPLVPVVRPPPLVRLDALWTSDGEDDPPARVQPARHAREAATPVRPPAINTVSRPVTIPPVRPLVPVVRPARLGALGSSDEEDDFPRRAQPVRPVREAAARITIPAIAPAPRAVTIPAARPLVPAVRPPAPARPGALLAPDDADDLPRRAQPARQVRTAAVPLRTNAIRAAAPLPPVSVSARPARPAFLRARPITACLICLDVPDEFPRNRPTTRCAHPITICAPCLEQHISHAVLSQGLTVITCPDASCRQNMEYSDVIRGTKNAKVCQDRYEALLLRRTLEAEPNFVWCKGANCNWGQVHESGANAPIVICQVCRARSCFTHNVPWHTGLTCAQYSAQHAHRDRENAASEAYISRHAKQCPNPRCGRRIEKNDGCDHMTCRLPAGCGHEFCWVCMADYRPILRDGNHLHNPTCRYYAAIQRAPAPGDILRGQDLPPPRPVYPGWARPAPVPVTPQPLRPPQPARPAQPEAPATGSFLGWVIGAVIAAFVVTR